MHRTSQLLLAGIAVAGLATACTSDGAANSTPIGSAPLPTASANTSSSPDDADVGTPRMSSEDARLLVYANALLLERTSREEQVAFLSENIPESEVEECMNAAGFEYVPEQSPEEMVDTDLRNTTTPEEYAAAYGLGITGSDLGIIPALEPPRNHEAAWSMTESEQRAYSAARGQCQGAFDPERRAWSDAINIAVNQFRAVLEADDTVAAALADWQACMAGAGFDFETPMQMRETFYRRMNTANRQEPLEEIFDDEVRVAVANVPCESAYTATYRQAISDRFDEFKTFFETALASGATLEAQG